MNKRTVIGIAMGWVAACGGSQQGGGQQEYQEIDVIPVEVTQEDQAAVQEEEDRQRAAEQAASAEAPPPEPGLVTFVVKVGNDTAAAQLELKNQAGDVVLTPTPGSQASVPSGEYTLVAKVTDASVLIDTPEREESVTISGTAQTVEVRFPLTRVRLRIRKAGRAIRSANVTLFDTRSQEELASFRVTDHHIAVTPGRYEADVQVGQDRIRVRGLIFPDGATTDIPVDLQ